VRRISIGIDGYNFAIPKGTGVATYGFNLARTLSDAGYRIEGVFGLDVGADQHLRETLFFDRIGKEQTGRRVFGSRWRRRIGMARATIDPWLSSTALDVPLTGNVDKEAFADMLPPFSRLVSAAGLFHSAQRHFSTTGRMLSLRIERPPEIMHWTYPVPVRLEGSRNIYTIHDLVPLRLPYTTLGDKPRFDRLFRAICDTADHVCTVSDYSRADILGRTGLGPDKVTNTHQTAFLPTHIATEPFEDAAAIVHRTLGLAPRSYFLFFGSLEPKKNLGRLLEAYLGLDTETPLVIVGARAWLSDGELSLLPPHQDDERGARVRRLDYLSRDLLLRTIRSAKAVLFPSISEGFGLPALEAMQLGTPVLTSNRSSLPEVAGDAALLVDPYDVGAIARGIARLDQDDALRARLTEAGPVQADRFSPRAYLTRLRAMYAGILGQTSGV
jgi:glycosyltransferase involved in cell wall biosynthesis